MEKVWRGIVDIREAKSVSEGTGGWMARGR